MEEPPAPDGPSRAPVTQRVPLEEVRDLLTRPARAAIAYVGPHGPECLPVVVSVDVGFRIGVDRDQLPAGGLPEQVVLVIDDGAYWFELRAAMWRGTMTPDCDGGADRTEGDRDRVWLGFESRHVTAWDYGQLHEEIQQ